MKYIDIKAFRNANNISQKQLADYLKVTQGLISQWESGKTQVPMTAVELILANDKKWSTPPLFLYDASKMSKFFRSHLETEGTTVGDGNNVNNRHDQMVTVDASIIEALRKSQEQIDRLLGIIESLTQK